MTAFRLSVIICTHNPRSSYLERVLCALREQSLPASEWELLLVDNASAEPLSRTLDLSWHPGARLVVESTLGLTPARLRGIREAVGEVLVFVDDDNVLSANYLEAALEVGREFPFVGAWGGSAHPEFESEPPAWTRPYWRMLAIREVERNAWSHERVPDRLTPNGAGLCVRRLVAEAYARNTAASPLRRGFDRKGHSLASGGDVDLALTASDLGLAHGLFPRLQLIHLIPSARLTEPYLLRLREGLAMSAHLLWLTRHPEGLRSRGWCRFAYDYLRKWGRSRKFLLAGRRGELKAAQLFAEAQRECLEGVQEPVLP